MKSYIAFFRGINVGGNKKVKMDELKLLFEKRGMSNIKTVLQTGNIVFESDESDTNIIKKKYFRFI